LALLCVLAYLPSLFLPLIEDDYPIISESRAYGSFAGLATLAQEPVFRSRSTSYWTINALWQVFQLSPPAFHAATLALHVVNTWIVYWLAMLWPRMKPAAFWAAAFFAVQEGHQEAVMWFTAMNELLQFGFGLGAVVCWLAAEQRRGSWGLRTLSVLLFAVAMLSKESAVIVALFFLLIVPPGEWRRKFPSLVPYFALAGLEAALVFAARNSSFRFADGSFSLHAPFWITWPRGIARVMWFWGWLSIAAVWLFSKSAETKRATLAAIAWIAAGLVPYSFLTYSTQIPSRQTYLASVGLVLLFGLAIESLQKAGLSRRWVSAILVLMILHNVGYLWTKKRRQFLERAAPTEQLIRLAREAAGPIWVRCFPRSTYIAEEAVHVAAGRDPADLVWTAEQAAESNAAAVFCYQEGGAISTAR
jgi:hypothetical protein